MASVEMIALLCAGSVKYHLPAVGGGSGDGLSRVELSGLLAGLSEREMHFALAKYAGDESSERRLIAHVRVWVAGVAIKEHWDIVKGRPSLCNLAALAVFEVVRPNRCARCHGSGVLGIRACGSCGGAGYRSLSGAVVADAIGVDRSNYSRLWRARYDQTYQYVNDLDANVKRVLGKADREDSLQVA